MKKIFKGMIAIFLAVSMLMSSAVVIFAAKEEVYLSDLRLIYADSYDEATQLLASSKLEGYRVFDENLNAGTGKHGVWLAYKTTTNIDDAITDVSVMQMGGGYSEGNYQQMIQKSKDDYIAMGNIYLEAIEYFAEAYDAGNFLAESAYRQLNVYAGVDLYLDDRIGDLFIENALTASDLATLFMQGNSYVLNNIRSLLAMGVSYNEEGLTYLQRVSLLASGTYSGYIDESVADVTADDIYISDNEDIDVLCALIAPKIATFHNMFDELSAYEDELNYEDEEFTDLEIKYAEYKAVAEMMRAVDYLNGQSLYDFCMNYTLDTKDYSSIYPLAKALNEGQISLTKVGHFYDVVRYSMSSAPEETINAQLDELEAQFAEKPFNVYTGVDRSVYTGTFALTSAAYRADAYTDSISLSEALFGNGAWVSTSAQIAAGAVGAGLFIWAIVRSVKGHMVTTETTVEIAAETIKEKAIEAAELLKDQTLPGQQNTNDWILETARGYLRDFYDVVIEGYDDLPFADRPAALLNEMVYMDEDIFIKEVRAINEECNKTVTETIAQSPKTETQTITTVSWSGRIFTGALYVAGALSMAYSAMSLYNKINDYYHPAYDVVPESMVDLVKTADGDRYIKYDVVCETTMQKNGSYAAADLNAFEGQRWNALYYTKSYEAGKPLLAEFVLSQVNNRPEEGYLAVHRFGEEICYDLNKYNFSNKSDNIFLSIAQSENQKSAVADVPDVIGSIFSNEFVFLAGGIGLALGIGGTIGVQTFLKKKKKGSDACA